MKIHSLKLTVQDMPGKDGKLFAAVYGTLTLDMEEPALDEKGEAKVDKEGQPISMLDDINFVTSLNSSPELKKVVQALSVEALTLKDMEVAKKNGQLSHYIEKIKALDPRKKKADKGPAPIPTPRRRTKKK